MTEHERMPGAELRRRLGIAGITQGELARRCEVSASAVTNWVKNGMRGIHVERVLTALRRTAR